MRLRKVLGVVALLWACVLVLPGSPQAQERPSVLVVYYSREGHTRMVAERLAEKFQADIQELVDLRRRTGPLGFTRAGKDAVAKNLTEIEPLQYDPRDYELILIGTPGWFGNMAPAVRTFLAEHAFFGKNIGLFGTAHLTGIESAIQQMALVISGEDSASIPTLPLYHRDLREEILRQKIHDFHELFLKKK